MSKGAATFLGKNTKKTILTIVTLMATYNVDGRHVWISPLAQAVWHVVSVDMSDMRAGHPLNGASTLPDLKTRNQQIVTT